MGEFEEFEEKIKNLTKSDSIKNNIAGFIDASIVLFLYILPFFLKFYFLIELSDFNKILSIFVIFIMYRLITILFFSRTIGMLILGIKFLKEDGYNLNFLEKILASTMIYINGVDCYNKTKN